MGYGMRKKILIIDDDLALGRLLVANFRTQGCDAFFATTAHDGLHLAFTIRPDLVILDVMLPDTDGWETCRRLREMSDIPIIMLTAINEGNGAVRSLNLGADDYLTKPFSLKELNARTEALFRRIDASPDRALTYSDHRLHIDLGRRVVLCESQIVRLTPTEFRLLEALVRNQGHPVTSDRLLADIWGPYSCKTTSLLAVYVRYLRKKLERDPAHPQYILTEWGIGYLFAPQDLGKS